MVTSLQGYDMFLLDTLQPIFELTPERPIIKIEWFRGLGSKIAQHVNGINYTAFDPLGK